MTLTILIERAKAKRKCFSFSYNFSIYHILFKNRDLYKKLSINCPEDFRILMDIILE